MNNFRDYINSSPNLADNAYRLRQLALQEALLAEAKKKKKKSKSDEKATKDWDGDGKIESGKQEYFGSKDKAIKAKMKNENYEATDSEVIEELLEHLFDEGELDLIIEAAEKKKWIQKAIKKEGSLRKTLKAKKGENISKKKLEAAAKKDGKTGKRARLALTLKKLNEEQSGATTRFNDGDDKPVNGDERVATQPDTLAELQGQLDAAIDAYDDVIHSQGREFAGSSQARAMKDRIAQLQNAVMKMTPSPKPIGADFFAQTSVADQSERIPSAAERGLNMGPKRVPPTVYDKGQSGPDDR